jgi:hypothetical protein
MLQLDHNIILNDYCSNICRTKEIFLILLETVYINNDDLVRNLDRILF